MRPTRSFAISVLRGLRRRRRERFFLRWATAARHGRGAFATAPRVLLLDEPLAGLAAAERERIGAIIKRISADLPVLLVEHDIDRVFALADRVTVMNEGRAFCSTERSRRRAAAKRFRRFISVRARLLLPHVREETIGHGRGFADR